VIDRFPGAPSGLLTHETSAGAAAERRLVYDVLGKGEAQTVTIVVCQYY
jgi:hypothetical protein